MDVCGLSIDEADEFFGRLKLTDFQVKIAQEIIKEVRSRLKFLRDVGLGYLTLDRESGTLSGGEAQRVKLVSHLLSGFKEPDLFDRKSNGNLFILEEPTIGLHMADVQRLVDVLQRLVNIGHSVLVIEHNLDVIAEADWVIDLGPEGGIDGGKIVAEGTPEQIAKNRNSYTRRFLREVLFRKCFQLWIFAAFRLFLE